VSAEGASAGRLRVIYTLRSTLTKGLRDLSMSLSTLARLVNIPITFWAAKASLGFIEVAGIGRISANYYNAWRRRLRKDVDTTRRLRI
jgi:hypothetical protein